MYKATIINNFSGEILTKTFKFRASAELGIAKQKDAMIKELLDEGFFMGDIVNSFETKIERV